MDKKEFLMMHSELIQYMQCIEYDLRAIYASMHIGDFEENYAELSKGNMNEIKKKLRKLDKSDGKPDLSEMDYELIDEIRNIRNYWCHQCYLDFVYLDGEKRDREFQKIAKRLSRDKERALELHQKIEKLRLQLVKKYEG